MKKSNSSRSGFSLIEMVIVILILGIIAAVTAPRMFDTAAKAEVNSTKQQLAILRNAIEMYRAEYGSYPETNQLDTRLVESLNGPFPIPQATSARGRAGVVYDSGADSTAALATSPSNTAAGWAYRPFDGRIKLNVETSDESYNW